MSLLRNPMLFFFSSFIFPLLFSGPLVFQFHCIWCPKGPGNLKTVNKILLSWFKKEVENFTRANLRIMTQEHHLGKFQELEFLYMCVCVCVCVCIFKQDCTLNEVLLTVTKSRFASTKWWAIVTLRRIKKECSLLRSCVMGVRRMLCFMAEQVFLPMRELWLMHNCKIQCVVERREEAKGQRKFFMFVFFLALP